MINGKPQADYEKILADNGMPVTEEQARAEFEAIVQSEGLITNTSRMSPFWRLITAIVTRPVMWLKDALVNVVMKNLFLATAEGFFLDIFAWAVNLTRKEATPASGVIRFIKSDISRPVTVPADTLIQTERINGVIYTLKTRQATLIPEGIAGMSVDVIAEDTGAGFNLAPGYYRILPVAVDGIDAVENEENWLTVPGADEESDNELRDRVRNQFNLAGAYHTDAVYRGLIAGVAGISADRIYFLHDAPRGPGTANAYIMLDAGIASEPFIDSVNSFITDEGHHGHGDDLRCFAMPETHHDLTVTLWLYAAMNLNEEEIQLLKHNTGNLIRCAFRENSDYDVQKTWPYSRFSMSRLGEELHLHFPAIESVAFSLPDIISDLDIPRLNQLTIEVEE
ncbi:baseplate J/gp47 family protein [Escherichia coli]|uniref:baseplate J/gp47 family protein n=1 Tax=Escherichia coli TaxID=562 RepID=UPI00209ADBF6|nr:baseplate J/gp47 family protein [Escherichia coli]MCO7874820.1 baseplate J/gp47 family protein [Escherichia coli]MCO7971606.1 baseplate J/gp47 family protein [Escherichia coli]